MNKIIFIKRKHSQTSHGKVALFPTIATVPGSSKSDSGWSRYRPNAKSNKNGLNMQ